MTKLVCYAIQALFEGVVSAAEIGGKRVPIVTQRGYTREQFDAIQRLKNAKSDSKDSDLETGHPSQYKKPEFVVVLDTFSIVFVLTLKVLSS